MLIKWDAPQKRRAYRIILILLGVSLLISLTVVALNQNLHLYFTPSEVAHNKVPQGVLVRVGGLVKLNSVVHGEGLNVQFTITDNTETVPVAYTGILPDLFKPGKGVVVLGKLNADKQFTATQVLAKHDENYRPPSQKIKEKKNAA